METVPLLGELSNWIVPASLTTGWFVALVLCSFATSAITAAVGVGGGVALLAILLFVIPPATVLPIHGFVQAGSNLGRSYAMRQSIHRPIVLWFTIGAIVGVFLAGLVFVAIPSRGLLLALGLFILWSLWAPRPNARSFSDRGFLIAGFIVSLSGMFLGATGPLMAAFLRDRQEPREWLVATQAASMSVMHLLKILAFGIIGFVYTEWMALILLMIVSGYVGTLSGKALLAQLPEALFAKLFKYVLSALALRLIWSATIGYAD